MIEWDKNINRLGKFISSLVNKFIEWRKMEVTKLWFSRARSAQNDEYSNCAKYKIGEKIAKVMNQKWLHNKKA